MREKYESLALVDLKEIAKARGMKGTSGMKKADIIEAMLLEDAKEKEAAERQEPAFDKPDRGRKPAVKNSQKNAAEDKKAGENRQEGQPRREYKGEMPKEEERNQPDRNQSDKNPTEKYPSDLDSGITLIEHGAWYFGSYAGWVWFYPL